MKKMRAITPVLLIALVAVSGCISGNASQNPPLFGPESQPARRFLYYSYSMSPALAENYAYLEGNTVTYFSKNVFNPDGVTRQETAILVPEVPEVPMDVQPFIALSQHKHPGMLLSEVSYFTPEFTEVYFGSRVPAVITIISDGQTDYLELYDLNTRKELLSETAANRESTFCSTIAKFNIVGTCSPEFNIGSVASYSLLTRDGWAEAIENMDRLDGAILSWWDFTAFYSIFAGVDAIPMSNNVQDITDTAKFFTAKASQWEDYAGWLSDKGVSYILLDYTMTPKYGAMAMLAGENTMIETFSYVRMAEMDYGALLIFKGTNNRELQIPLSPDGGAAGAVQLSEGGRAVYFNQMCTKNGLETVGSEPAAEGGCIAMSGNYAYIIPEDVVDNIFTSMMFLKGKDLPVEKVFENTYVKIYRIS